MKNILSAIFLITFFILITLGCSPGTHSDNPIVGRWNSIWDKQSQIMIFDFNVSFETNNTYHIEVLGVGQVQPLKIVGEYKMNGDTITVLDRLSEPIQICNYADTGMYTVKRRNDTLFFAVIKDRCERRRLRLEIGLIKAK